MNTIFLTEWRERLNSKNISQYRRLANNWLTCATGDRVFKEFGRRSKNYSDDLSGEARKTGQEFTNAVKACDIEKAQEALEKIENFESIWAFDVKEELTKPIGGMVLRDEFKDKPVRAKAHKPKPKKRKPRT